MSDFLLLACAGVIAGAMNALAGGGSFVTLPVLIATGVPSVAANASSTVALYPGGVASAWVYRDGLRHVCGLPIPPTLIATLTGGLIGALLLLWTPTQMFDQFLPWLLLTATLTLTSGPRLGAVLRSRLRISPPAVLTIQLLLGIYGGYFGGAVGLMMMAVWCLLDSADLKTLHPPRTLMVTAANSVAVLCFVLAGVIAWSATLVLGAGALIGGTAGAHLGRRLSAGTVRTATLCIAWGMTAAFFWRAYG